MKIPVFKPSEDPVQLQRQLLQLQERLNAALDDVSVKKLSVTLRPEDLPRVLPTRGPVWGVKIVYLRNLTDDSVTPIDGVFLNWIPEAGGVKIREVTGLATGQLYEIRMVVYGP